MTLPEVLLWNLLRKSPNGIHFRRQEWIGDYVVDFYCAPRKVVIEIDGLAHDMGRQPLIDEKRDEWLRTQGIDVLRIAANEVLKSPQAVAESILRYCEGR